MKTLQKALVAAALALPMVARAGIIGTPHDFSGESWNIAPGDNNSVCGACHQPHNADSSVVPLWAHKTTSSSFIMYNDSTVPASDLQSTPDGTPGGISKACLSCHDGTIAINTYGGTTWGGTGITITNSANLGTDLTHTHPISLVYDDSIAGQGSGKDKYLFDPATKNVLVPDSGTFDIGNDPTVKGFLLNGGNRLECSACHDVHNQVGSPYSVSLNPKLVKIVGTQAGKGSLLCRSCHDK